MKPYPDRKNTLALLDAWQKHHAATNKMMDGIQQCIGMDPNGPLFEIVWRLFDAYTDALAAQLGDFCGWLSWYFMENDFGANGMAAGYDGKTKAIKKPEHLYSLIAESRKRNGATQ